MFIAFLHDSASATDVELEPAEAGRYRFRVSVPPSAVIEALLASSDFFPESEHSSISGPLEVRLTASDSVPSGTPKRVETRPSTALTSAVSSSDSEAKSGEAGGSSLLQAFEHLDKALGDTSTS
jgi:hypothetical protein